MNKHESKASDERSFELERIVFFSDAVYAIAITLLAIELKVPDLKIESTEALLRALLSEWPRFLAFTFSFGIVAIYWLAHHRYFRYIKRYDERLIALNMLMLFFIALIPFSASILGEYGNLAGGIWVYAANMFFLGIAGGALWHHATTGHRLTAPDLDTQIVRYIQLRAFATPLAAVLVVVLSFFIGSAANFGWLLIFVWQWFVARRYKPRSL